MKELINNLITIFNNATALGRVALKSVRKGIHHDPAQIPFTEYPYLALDDSGQKVEEIKSDSAQRRVFSIMFEIGVQVLDIEQSLDDILDITDQIKAELELEINRPYLYDSHIWAITANTFSWGADEKFFRGIQIVVEFYLLELRFSDY